MSDGCASAYRQTDVLTRRAQAQTLCLEDLQMCTTGDEHYILAVLKQSGTDRAPDAAGDIYDVSHSLSL